MGGWEIWKTSITFWKKCTFNIWYSKFDTPKTMSCQRHYLVMSKLRGRLHQIFWPSKNIWPLLQTGNLNNQGQCQSDASLKSILENIFMGHEIIPDVVNEPPQFPLELTYKTIRTFPGKWYSYSESFVLVDIFKKLGYLFYSGFLTS